VHLACHQCQSNPTEALDAGSEDVPSAFRSSRANLFRLTPSHLWRALIYLTHYDPGHGRPHNAEGVSQFQPRAAPWERNRSRSVNSERVRQTALATKLSGAADWACEAAVTLGIPPPRTFSEFLNQGNPNPGVALGCYSRAPPALLIVAAKVLDAPNMFALPIP
jgi:hypothetical protein